MALTLAATLWGEQRASAIQLALEYDPQPPFDHGSPEKAAPEIDQQFAQYPNYRDNADERRDLTAELYKILLPHVSKTRRAALVDEILKMRRK